jgi:hypothetical protein
MPVNLIRVRRSSLTVVLGVAIAAVGLGQPASHAAPTDATQTHGTIVTRASWRILSQARSRQLEFEASSCTSDGHCMFLGEGKNELLYVTQVSQTGTLNSMRVTVSGIGGTPTISTISCSSAAFCLAVGHDGARAVAARSLTFGRTWIGEYVQRPELLFLSVVCVSTVHCLAMGEESHGFNAVVSDDGGRKWSLGSPEARYQQSQVACAVSRSCAVSTGSAPEPGEIAVSRNFGASWKLIVRVAGRSVWPITCASECIAAVQSESQQSAPWLVRFDPEVRLPKVSFVRSLLTGIAINSIWCANAEECVIVGARSLRQEAAAEFTSDGGANWVDLPLPRGLLNLLWVSCGSISRCTASAESSSGYDVVLRYQ